MTENVREPLLPLIVSLIGVSVMITACSVVLVPYHTYRWIRRRVTLHRAARAVNAAAQRSTWRLRSEPVTAPSSSLLRS